jgi:putative addiction module component (TIGR02574 family)
MSTDALTELMKLPSRQRLAIAEQLWLSVADEESMPVPDEHRRIVKDRLERYRTGQAKVLTHAELLRRVQTA